MALSTEKAERLAEELHDFNPNLTVDIKPSDHSIVATIPKLKLQGEQFTALAQILGKHPVTFDTAGNKLRMIIT